jgi:hypothetical protein
MKRRFCITVFSAMLSAAGAVVLSGSSRPASAQGIPDRMCDEDGLCTVVAQHECCHGQFSGGPSESIGDTYPRMECDRWG